MRRFTSFRRANTFSGSLPDPEKSSALADMDAGTIHSSHDAATETNVSTAALLSPSVPLPPPNLQVKRLDYYYSKWTRSWKYKNMGEKVTPEAIPIGSSSGNDPWQSYCFVVVRKLPRDPEVEPTFESLEKWAIQYVLMSSELGTSDSIAHPQTHIHRLHCTFMMSDSDLPSVE